MLLCASPWASAQSASQLSSGERTVANFGFATQLGSGVYSVGGRTLQIYRLPFGYTLRPPDAQPYGLRLTLPVTFGSYDFKPRDRSAIALPRHVDTLSFVPGVAMQFALRPHWQLEPYVEAGIARSSDADLQATTYAGGLRSRYDFEAGRFHAQLYNEIIYAALDFHGSPAHEQFMRLRNGITASRPFESRPSYDYLIYAMADTYAASTQGIPAQFEVGITFGATAPRKLWRIPLPRVGLGYRFGDHLAVPRLVFGAPF